jgi:hypothetical protein
MYIVGSIFVVFLSQKISYFRCWLLYYISLELFIEALQKRQMFQCSGLSRGAPRYTATHQV